VTTPYWHEHLALSGLDVKDVKKLRLKWLSPAGVQSILQSEFSLPCGGIHFPYFTLDGKLDDMTCRVRLLVDPANGYAEDNLPRYLQPPGTPPRIYLPPLLDWMSVSQDTSRLIIITEGEKKAAAACKAGFACIGLGGVWSFQQKDTGVALLPDLSAFDWAGRQVVVAYDSDWAENKDVRKASGMLARRLSERGAEVRAALIGGSPGGGKLGIDDLLVKRGTKALQAIIDTAMLLTPEAEAMAEYRKRYVLIESLACAYDTKKGGLYTRRRFEDSHPHDFLPTVSPTGRSVTTTKAKYWWEDPSKRCAYELVLEPNEPEITKGGNLNRFKGWGVEPQRGNTEVWQTLLKIVFQNRKDQIAWFEKWCAFPIQHPGAKLHSTVFIFGGQGVGKTAIGRILLDIYGKSGRLIGDREVFGGFNGWVGETLFALGDDLAFDERKKSRAILKMLVDSESLEVNEKYVPSYSIDNRCNFYFTANSPGALPLDPSGTNRRFMVIEAPMHRTVPPEWYTKTLDSWRAEGGSAYVHDRLRKLELGDFHAYADAPRSDAKDLVVETGRSGVESWCSEISRHTTFEIYTSQELYGVYRVKTGDTRTGPGAFTSSLRLVAQPLGPHRVGEDRLSLWAVRNKEKWLRAKPKARVEQYTKERPKL